MSCGLQLMPLFTKSTWNSLSVPALWCVLALFFWSCCMCIPSRRRQIERAKGPTGVEALGWELRVQQLYPWKKKKKNLPKKHVTSKHQIQVKATSIPRRPTELMRKHVKTTWGGRRNKSQCSTFSNLKFVIVKSQRERAEGKREKTSEQMWLFLNNPDIQFLLSHVVVYCGTELHKNI